MIRELPESVAFDKEVRHDPAKGIVYNVKICGHKSAHGHRYTRDCLKRAIPLYEGRQVNVDHTPGRKTTDSRLYAERFGRVRKVHLQEGRNGPELRGNLHYNVKHAIAPQFAWDVDNDPNNCGLSHMARGDAVSRNGEVLVESINFVRSVDLVADPATNVGLFEDRGGRMKRVKVRRKSSSKSRRRRQLIEDMWDLVEDSGDRRMVDLFEAAVADAPASDVGSPDEAMGKMLMAVWMDGSMDLEEKRTKINAIIDLAEEQESDTKPESPEEDAGDTIPEDIGGNMKRKTAKKGTGSNELVEDVANVKEELANMKKARRIDELCEDAGFRPTKIQRRALMGLGRVSEVKELIESFNGAEDREPITSKKAKAKAKGQSRKRSDDDSDFDPKDFAESLISAD